MKIKNLPNKIYLNISANEDEVDYNDLDGVTFSTEPVGVTDCDTENVCYIRQTVAEDEAQRNEEIAKAINLQRELAKNGEVAFYECDRLVKAKLEDLATQHIDGLLYDLNRDEATICVAFPAIKVMNELATIAVLKYLHKIATDDDYCCGGCEHFQNEAADGTGVCDVDDKVWNCDHVCAKCKKKK